MGGGAPWMFREGLRDLVGQGFVNLLLERVGGDQHRRAFGKIYAGWLRLN